MRVSQIAYMSSAYRNLYVNQTNATKSLQRLSSGYRINSAADDAAGLAISERMRGQIGGLNKVYENTQNSISMTQTAEGGLDTASSILTRMRELSVQAQNGTYSDDERSLLNQEFQDLKSELDRLSSATQYNGTSLLDGSLGGTVGGAGLAELGIASIDAGGTNDYTGNAKFNITQENGAYTVTAQIGDQTVSNVIGAGDTSTTLQFADGNELTLNFTGAGSLQEGVITNVGVEAGSVATDTTAAISATGSSDVVFQIGANGGADQRVSLSIGDMSSVGLGIQDLDISTLAGANNALKGIDNAVNQVNSQRSSLGAMQNRLEHSLSNLGVTRENLVASESRIRDLDMAEEIMKYTQRNLQLQASQAMLAQGMNLNRQNLMSLLLR